MSAIDYSQLATDALAAIQDAGQTVTVKRYDRVYDPVTGSVSQAAYVAGQVALIKVPIPVKRAALMERRLQEALTEGKVACFIVAAAGSPFDISLNDVFELEGGFWLAKGITPLNPAGIVLIYTIIAESSNLSAVDAAALDLSGLDIDGIEAAVDGLYFWFNTTFPHDIG